MKKFSELIEEAVNCIKTYNRVIKTIDSHADDFLAAVSTLNLNSNRPGHARVVVDGGESINA